MDRHRSSEKRGDNADAMGEVGLVRIVGLDSEWSEFMGFVCMWGGSGEEKRMGSFRVT